MASTASAPRTKTAQNDVITDAVRARATPQRKTAEKATEAAFENIAANTFVAIIFNAELSPEQKREEVAKALTFTGTKEENRARVQEFEVMKEYLQHLRSEMAQEIIRLTDTEAFAELKRIYDEINTALLDFDQKMVPLVDIIDAVFTLRTEGETLNAFRDIQKDREREVANEVKRKALGSTVESALEDIRHAERQIAEESQKKSWFGMGGIKPEAQRRIDELQIEISQKRETLGTTRGQLDALQTESTGGDPNVKFAAERKQLRNLLDISTDTHRERQEELVASALKFVQTAKDRIGAVRSHLGSMNSQVEGLGDANSQMTQAYAILNEGIKGAEKSNQEIRSQLVKPEGTEEDLIAKMTREEKKSNLDSHIKLLDSSAADTMLTYTDLTTQTIRIKAMQDSNSDQLTKARSMHAQGIAGVADRLSVVLQAVSSAAINESSAMARDTLGQMANNTNRIAQKEVIRVATGMSDTNDSLMKAMDDLSAYGEVLRTGTDITRSTVQEMREKLVQMQKMAEEVQSDIRESVSVHAEVGLAEKPRAGKAASSNKGLPNFFKTP